MCVLSVHACFDAALALTEAALQSQPTMVCTAVMVSVLWCYGVCVWVLFSCVHLVVDVRAFRVRFGKLSWP